MADSREYDVLLPWQYTLLGFLLFGLLLAGAAAGIGLAGELGSQNRPVANFGTGYIVMTIALAPVLWLAGRAKVRRMKETYAAVAAGNDPVVRRLSNFGVVKKQSTSHGVGIGLISALVGAVGFIGMLVTSGGQWTRSLIFLVPLIGGVSAMVYHGGRREA